MTQAQNTLKKIRQCSSCNLCNNQRPLLDNKSKADVMWVGLSAVRVEDTEIDTPLSELTNTGQLLLEIENRNPTIEYYKTNLVKCLPIENDKIRYPKKNEMGTCYKNLQIEVNELKPKIVFLLGKLVADFIGKNKFEVNFCDQFKYNIIEIEGTIYVPVHHPSYILVYKRKNVQEYINGISKLINKYSAPNVRLDMKGIPFRKAA
jgi:uracil-DNA glycosylase family 4